MYFLISQEGYLSLVRVKYLKLKNSFLLKGLVALNIIGKRLKDVDENYEDKKYQSLIPAQEDVQQKRVV